MFNPKYKITDNIVKMLTAVAEAKAVIERAKILPKNELKLRRQALIRMTHSSTAIEGNQLNMHEVEALVGRKKVDAPQREIFEVQNYLNALKYIEQVVKKKQAITEKVLLKIHKLVTDKTLDEESSGHYRKGPVYIVRRRLGFPNEVMYTGPDAKKVPKLCADLISWIEDSKKKDTSPIIVAGIAHQEIAAIHPFNDGNGRTARALATLILYKRGYDFRKLFALEDYYNKDRQRYYKAINIGKTYDERKTDFTLWLEYFSKGFKEEIDNVKNKIISLSAMKIDADVNSQIYLDKDQMKILDFLDKLGKINVNDVVDILNCPKRTAQLHLQKLKKIGSIKQVGKGPASAYVFRK
ncbi:MAG TPA: Fic family protein [Candidatus Moranbacteria bacterium]|nr:Fic family protein [Candidatus Moranbacteria bacterium]